MGVWIYDNENGWRDESGSNRDKSGYDRNRPKIGYDDNPGPNRQEIDYRRMPQLEIVPVTPTPGTEKDRWNPGWGTDIPTAPLPSRKPPEPVFH